MSGTFPSTPLPSAVSVLSVSPTQADFTHSGRRNVRQFGAQKWKIDLKFPATLNRDQFMPIFAFTLSQAGKFGTFSYVPPDLAVPRGSPSGTPLVAVGNQVGQTMSTYGWDNTLTVFKTGDVFKVAGHNKVYMLTADATSDGSGNSTLEFFPPLIESPAGDEAVIFEQVPFTVQITSDTSNYSVRGPFHYSFDIQMIEVV
jgi:hypothetical protein